jgi:hypothetical protein
MISERLYRGVAVKTEANGDSKSTYERGHSLVGFSGLS